MLKSVVAMYLVLRRKLHSSERPNPNSSIADTPGTKTCYQTYGKQEVYNIDFSDEMSRAHLR